MLKKNTPKSGSKKNGQAHLNIGIFLLISAVFYFIYDLDLKDLYVLSLGLIGLGGIFNAGI
jgi:hypothetical protein